jgi:hypothetical protein
MKKQFLPKIAEVFKDHTLTERQLAAVISFYWRNGKIAPAQVQWVREFLAGNTAAVADAWMNWADHGRQIPRATAERDLFMGGAWPNMQVTVYRVAKPSYKAVPQTRKDFSQIVQQIMGGS